MSFVICTFKYKDVEDVLPLNSIYFQVIFLKSVSVNHRFALRWLNPYNVIICLIVHMLHYNLMCIECTVSFFKCSVVVLYLKMFCLKMSPMHTVFLLFYVLPNSVGMLTSYEYDSD